MSSAKARPALSGQQGAGLVEVLVSVALLGIALVVMLGSVSSLLLGARISEHRMAAQRLARNTVETARAAVATSCVQTQSTRPARANGVVYSVREDTDCNGSLAVITVQVTDPSGARFSLTDEVLWR